MSFNGQKKPHQKSCGYIVLFEGMAGTVCHGFNDSDLDTLLGGNPATLFESRKAAQSAIMTSVADAAARHESQFKILRVAKLK